MTKRYLHRWLLTCWLVIAGMSRVTALPTTFHHFDTHGRIVASMAMDTDGNLWLATNQGVLRLDELSADDEASMERPAMLQCNARTVQTLNDGLLLIRMLDSRCIVYNPVENTATNLSQVLTTAGFIVDGELRCDAEEGHPVVWWQRTMVWMDAATLQADSVVTADTIIFRPTPEERVIPCEGEAVGCSATLANGHHVLGTKEHGLVFLDEQGRIEGRTRHDPQLFNSLGSDRIKALYTDPRGTLWVAYSKGGLSMYVPDMPPLRLHTIDALQTQGLLTDVGAITYTADGLLVGTDGNGLHPTTIPDLEDAAITSIYYDDMGGRICVGAYERGLFLKDGRHVRRLLEGLSPYGIGADSHGRLIVGTLGHGLFIEDADTLRPLDVGANWIMQVCCRKGETAWLATTDGLVRLDTRTQHHELITASRRTHIPFTHGRLASAVADRRGLVWMICSDGEDVLNVFDSERDSLYRFPDLTTSLRSIVEDADGNMWLATTGELIKTAVSFDARRGAYDFLSTRFPAPFTFNARAATLLPDGALAFGTTDGWLTVGDTGITLNEESSDSLYTLGLLTIMLLLCLLPLAVFFIRRRRSPTQAESQKPFPANNSELAVALPVTQPEVTTPDARLIARATAIVEDHIADSEFSVEQLAELLGMHRSNLTRRLSAATGLTPLAFIRRVRLLRARHLIEQGRMMVSEAAYAVGYNSPKLFTRQFKEEFGITPSELHRSDSSVKPS